MVQIFLSSQSESCEQQFGLGTLRQVLLARSHESSVQTTPSSQVGFSVAVQQSARVTLEQVCEVWLQVSVVQNLPSSHWLSRVQQPGTSL